MGADDPERNALARPGPTSPESGQAEFGWDGYLTGVKGDASPETRGRLPKRIQE
jgi:hypothetical protein